MSDGIVDSSNWFRLGLWLQSVGVSVDGLPVIVYPRCAAYRALREDGEGQ